MSKKRIKELALRITEAKDYYYNKDPILTDNAFDALCDELRTLDPKNKVLSEVGAPIVQSEWKKGTHKIPMNSLEKVNTPEELSKWIEDVAPNEKFLVMEKLDGISINVIWKNGKFVDAYTRGNSIEGEAIGVNVIKMEGIKPQFNGDFTGSFRGEIVMKKSIHQKYFSNKSNPRNACAGISKRLDGIGVEHLTVIFYQVISEDLKFPDIPTEADALAWLNEVGFITPNNKFCNNADEIIDWWKEYQDKIRETLDYEIDGLVVRLNDCEKQNELGLHEGSGNPKFAKAFKFANEMRETKLLGVEWEVGNSGRITPIALLEPVIIGGVEVQRASMHNVRLFNKLELYIGCNVLVSRRNDVIPYIEQRV